MIKVMHLSGIYDHFPGTWLRSSGTSVSLPWCPGCWSPRRTCSRYYYCHKCVPSGCLKILLFMALLMFQLARVAMEYSCFSRPAETILAKCARFLKIEISRNFGVLKLLSKDDYEIFQVATLYFRFSIWQLWKIELVPLNSRYSNTHICHIKLY